MKDLGKRIMALRKDRKISREELCDDETELSVRQLARIETGNSLPTVNKLKYIAQKLGVTVGTLADERDFALPTRYKELKYLLLQTQTYMDDERVKLREQQLEEIMTSFYDKLPEEEQLIVDCIQSKIDVALSGRADFGRGILEDYFEQVKKKKLFRTNDLILLDLYMLCIDIEGFDDELFLEEDYDHIAQSLLKQATSNVSEDWSILMTSLLSVCTTAFEVGKYKIVKEALAAVELLMAKLQDFRKTPALKVMEWKYYLTCEKNIDKARRSYETAVMYAQMVGDDSLLYRLREEWEKDNNRA